MSTTTPTYDLRRTEWPDDGTWPKFIQPNHAEYLVARGVSPEVARARGYLSLVPTTPSWPPGNWGQAVRAQFQTVGNAALIIPTYSAGRPDPVAFQLRLDFPRLNEGKPRKFELPAGAERGTHEGSIPADVNPLAFDLVDDSTVPVILTEGVVKGDAILSAARTIGLPLLPVSLSGVWMATYGPHSGKDLESGTPQLVEGIAALHPSGRLFYLAWDADWRINPGVSAALRQLADVLIAAGADVRIVDVAPVDGDAKTGIDDALAHFGPESLRELLGSAIDPSEIPEGTPGTALAARERTFEGEDVAELLQVCAGLYEDNDGGWCGLEVQGTSEGKAHAIIRRDTKTGGTRLLVRDREFAKHFGLKFKGLLDPLSILAAFACDGDWSLTGRVAYAFRDNFAGLIQMLETDDADALAKRYPARGSLAEVDVDFRAAVEAFKADPSAPEVVVPLGVDSRGRRVAAIVGGKRHGLVFEVEEKGVEGTPPRRYWMPICPYLVFRTRKEAVLGVDEGGHPVELADPTYSVEILRADSRSRSLEGFSTKDSVSPAETVDRLDFGESLPDELFGVKIIGNALRALGYSGRENVAQFTTTGWAYFEGTPRYQAPLGSITADGITHDVVVGPPLGSDPAGFAPAMRQNGFPKLLETQEEWEAASGTIRAFLGIAPGRPDLGIALLGAVFSAPLRMSGRAAILLTGPPKSRKSHLASAAQSFFSGVRADAKDFTIDVDKSTLAPAESNSAWSVDGLVVADDFRLDTDARRNEISEQILRGLIQGAYSGATAARGKRTGGVRASQRRADTVIVTGETFSGGSATASRAVHVAIDRNSIPEFGENGKLASLDDFREKFADRGLPRQVMAEYLVFLAEEMAEHGGTDPLRWLRTTADGVREEDRRTLRNDRTGEVVAAISTGWHFLRKFAAMRTFGDDFLPSEAEVAAALQTLIRGSQLETAEADPGLLTLRKLGELITSGEGYLSSSDGREPNHADLFGWRFDSSGASALHGGSPYRPGRNLVGQLALDGRHVVISPAGIDFARLKAGLGALKISQIRQALIGRAVEGTNPGDRPPAGYLSGGPLYRRHGWVFPLEAIGLTSDLPDGADLEAEHAELVASMPF